MAHVMLFLKRTETNEVEWTREAGVRILVLAVVKAYEAVFWPTEKLKEKGFDSCGSV